MDAVEHEASTDSITPLPVASAILLELDGKAVAAMGSGADAEAIALDWDNSGNLALLVTAETGSGRQATLYKRAPEPEGDGTTSPCYEYEAGQHVAGLDGLRGLCPLPSGGSTRFDLVGLDPALGLVSLRNVGTPTEPRFDAREPIGFGPDLGLGPVRITQITADDWDGDGTVDLLVGLDSLEGYWPDDLAALPPSQRLGWDDRGRHPGFDRNSRWRGAPAEGRLYWLRNTGAPGAPRFEPPEAITAEGAGVTVGQHPVPLAVSWGGSRGVELLLTDSAGTVRLHRNFGGQRPPVLLEPRPITLDGTPLRLPLDRTTIVAADLDGDGQAELLGARADGRLFAICAAKGRDAAQAPVLLNSRGGPLWLGGGAVVSVADLDGDGDLDLVAGDASGRLWMAEDIGGPEGPRYAAPVELDAQGLPYRLSPGVASLIEGPAARSLGWACPTIADWDGNGRPDLIVSGAGGDVLFFHHNGGPTQPRFERPLTIRLEGEPLLLAPRVRPAAIASREGSNELDLIGVDPQGFLVVYPRVGPQEVGPPEDVTDTSGRPIRLDGGFGLAGRVALWAGPWTAPGRRDILVGLPRDARFVVPALTGQRFDSFDAIPTVLLLQDAGRGCVVPRPVYLADGSPLVLGRDGCSPCGAGSRTGNDGEMDLLVGSDDGRVRLYPRSQLRW